MSANNYPNRPGIYGTVAVSEDERFTTGWARMEPSRF